MLEIKNLSKTYMMPKHKVEALKNVSFTTGSTGMVAVLGPSGSGKTTLMNIIGALDSDFDGDVVVNGKSLQNARGRDLDTHRRDTVGFVFQHFALVPSLTGQQNVELALELSRSKDKALRATALLERVGLAGHTGKKVNRLSGGQKQRVAIARALANDPDIILADEPTGSLDSVTGRQVMDLLKELSREKLVVIITHSPSLAEDYADTIVTMKDGEIVDTKRGSHVEAPAAQQKKVDRPARMSLGGACRYALRNLWIKKGRTIATALGTSIGIIGIALAIALASGASASFEAQIREVFPINNITVTPYSDDGAMPGMGFEPWSYADVQAAVAVSERLSGYHATPARMFLAMGAGLDRELVDQGTMEDYALRMLDLSRPAETVEDVLYLGSMPEAGNAFEVVLPMNTANSLLEEGEDLSSLLGASLYVRHLVGGENTGSQPVHFTLEYTIVGITSTNTLGDALFLVSDANIQLLEQQLDVDRQDMEFVGLTVYADSGVGDITGFIAELNQGQSRFTYVSTLESTIDGVNATLAAIRNVLIGLSSISILVALLMIAIVIFISVLEKIQEIGIIRAVGGRRADIRNIFFAEAAGVGLLSGVTGTGIAWLLSKLINAIAGASIGGGPLASGAVVEIARLSLPAALGLIAACMGLSIISGYIPARKAASMDPVAALRHK